MEGKWVVRRYAGDGAYVVETIATADDVLDADGERVLTFFQAQDRARQRGGELVYAGPYRVRDAVEDYLEFLDGRSSANDCRIRCETHIIPPLGDELVERLTAEKILAWHRGLARSGPMIPNRGKSMKGRIRTIDLDDPEQVRKRQCTSNRVLAILKAILNRAFREGKVSSDAAWRRVRPFKGVERSRNRYLSLAECERLTNAADPGFRPLVRGALETGARYGELCALTCGDYNPDSGTIHIRKSKSGKERHIILSQDGQEFFAQLTVGQPASAPMFGRLWKRSNQARPFRQACVAARIEPINFHQLRHSWASHAVMGGMPLAVVARNLGHVDTVMVERHYGHLAPSYVVDQVRKHAPRFGTVETNVKAIR